MTGSKQSREKQEKLRSSKGPHKREKEEAVACGINRPADQCVDPAARDHRDNLMTIGHYGLAVPSRYHFIILPRETLTNQDIHPARGKKNHTPTTVEEGASGGGPPSEPNRTPNFPRQR